MRRTLLVAALIAVNLGTGFAERRANAGRTKLFNARKMKPVIVAFYDEERLGYRVDGETMLETFNYFLKPIQEIAQRDFPDIEFRILRRGDFLRLPDGVGFNVQNIDPVLGYVRSVRGKKHQVLRGPQSEADFACAAAAFFRRSSPACSKITFH